MELIIDFPGGSRVDAHFGPLPVQTDQPSSASVPWLKKIDLQIKLPPGFGEKYREAVIHAAQLCAVKKHLEHPPKFEITTTMR